MVCSLQPDLLNLAERIGASHGKTRFYKERKKEAQKGCKENINVRGLNPTDYSGGSQEGKESKGRSGGRGGITSYIELSRKELKERRNRQKQCWLNAGYVRVSIK